MEEARLTKNMSIILMAIHQLLMNGRPATLETLSHATGWSKSNVTQLTGRIIYLYPDHDKVLIRTTIDNETHFFINAATCCTRKQTAQLLLTLFRRTNITRASIHIDTFKQMIREESFFQEDKEFQSKEAKEFYLKEIINWILRDNVAYASMPLAEFSLYPTVRILKEILYLEMLERQVNEAIS